MSNNTVRPSSERVPSPAWVEHAIGWHVYPLGFVGAPIHEHEIAVQSAPGAPVEHEPRLNRMLPWLNYIQGMGLNVLQLGPVFESTSHGYDTLDYFRIDPRLGTEDDMVRLIAHAHDRGIKVLFDGVFNHIGSQAPMFRTALEDPDSSEAELFDIDRSVNPPSAPCFEGNFDLIEFNHKSTATKEFVASVMDYWLARGVDGWRLDAAYAVDPKFWAEILPGLREKYPHAYFYGEVIHGDYPNIVRTSTFDAVTEYELWKSIWSSLKEKNFFELEWTLKRHNEFLKTFVPLTFVGNHDVTRIASKVGQDKAVLALTVLMTVGGLPVVYYGDEQGYTGVKEDRAGGDDQVRPLMPPSPDELSPIGEWILRAHQQLIALRRRHPWLHTAITEITEVANGKLSYVTKATDGSNSQLTVTLSIDGSPTATVAVGDSVDFRFPES